MVGSALGVAGGVLYAKAILCGLATLWRAAVADSPLRFHVTAPTLAGGGLPASSSARWSCGWRVRAQAGRPARELLEQGNELERGTAGQRRRRRWAGWVALRLRVGALALAAGALAQTGQPRTWSPFSAAARLLLIAGIAAGGCLVSRAGRPRGLQPLSLSGLGVRGLRPPRRAAWPSWRCWPAALF